MSAACSMSARLTRSMPSMATPSKSTRVPKAVAASSASFLRRVDAAHVEGGIGLGVPELLRLLEHHRIGCARRLHPGQDVVAGAVEHAHHPDDRVAGKPLGQRLDHGDAARDRRFEAQRDTGRLGRLGEVLAVAREHRLVRGDDVAPARDRGLGGRLGRPVLAADHLDDEIDVLAPGECHGIVLPGIGGEIDAAVAVARAGRDRDDLDRAAGAGGDQPTMGLEHGDHAGPDSAESGDGDAQRVGHGALQGHSVPPRP
jgi:hypothetical protein